MPKSFRPEPSPAFCSEFQGTVDQKPRELSIDQINAFVDLARMVVDEIEFREIATTDSLTGALTRLGFEIKIEREFRRTKRYNKKLSLIEIDIDYFKAVNDRYGHAVGDLVLQNLVSQIKEELRTVDFIGRQGGDELVTALPETDIDEAMKLAERFREKNADTRPSCKIHFDIEREIARVYHASRRWPDRL